MHLFVFILPEDGFKKEPKHVGVFFFSDIRAVFW